MKTKRSLFLVLSAALAAPACGSSTPSSTTGPKAVCEGTSLKADEAHNYSVTSTITLPPIKIAQKQNITFDWSAVTKDLLGHSVDLKKDVKRVVLLAWNIPLSNAADPTKSLQYKFIHDTIDGPDMVGVPMQYTPAGATSAKLYDFTLSGNPVTPEQINTFFDISGQHPPENYCYTLMVSSSEQIGSGAITLQSMVLDENSTNTEVKVTDASTKLDFHADLTKLTPTGIPEGTGDITLDWSDIKKNAMGDEFFTNSITTALVGHYTETAAELSTDKFLSLDRIATELYRADIDTGTTLKLSDMKDSSGKAFSGITGDGTWILGLQCGSCKNPSPLYVTILVPACSP
jgi:hypothetical protein